ncbi:hypothetical protein B5M44_20965 [Shinella sumterensis]|nr:hypothetical protein B5M44_20965 [Shinella sumterensis]
MLTPWGCGLKLGPPGGSSCHSHADRIRAVELYIKLGKRVKATIRQLGYHHAARGHSPHRTCA